MLADLLFQCIGFAIQTVILFGLLWLMIKIQKIDRRFEFSFVGVFAAAAIATGLTFLFRLALGPLIGLFLVSFVSAPIVFIVLLYRIKKATGADYVDSLLTVAVARAVLFVANFFLLAALMGTLQTRIHKAAEFETVVLRHRIKAEPTAAISTNSSVSKTNPPVVAVAAAPVKPAAAIPVEPAVPKPVPAPIPAPIRTTNPPAQSPVTNPVTPMAPPKSAESLSKYFSLKGVTRNGANSAATIQTGTRVYTVFLEEAALMQTVNGPISVRFAELGENTVTLEINGEPTKFSIPKP